MYNLALACHPTKVQIRSYEIISILNLINPQEKVHPDTFPYPRSLAREQDLRNVAIIVISCDLLLVGQAEAAKYNGTR